MFNTLTYIRVVPATADVPIILEVPATSVTNVRAYVASEFLILSCYEPNLDLKIYP